MKPPSLTPVSNDSTSTIHVHIHNAIYLHSPHPMTSNFWYFVLFCSPSKLTHYSVKMDPPSFTTTPNGWIPFS